jgi:hypothetical protein
MNIFYHFNVKYELFFNLAFLMGAKNMAEQNITKGASPTGVLYSLAAYWRRTVTVSLSAVIFAFIF